MYERGSFGHGCEKARFGIKRKQVKEDISQADQSKHIINYQIKNYYSFIAQNCDKIKLQNQERILLISFRFLVHLNNAAFAIYKSVVHQISEF